MATRNKWTLRKFLFSFNQKTISFCVVSFSINSDVGIYNLMTTILIKVIGFDTYCNDFTLGLNTVWVEIHVEAIYSLFACQKFPFFITIVPVAVVIRPKTVTNQLASIFLKIIGISIQDDKGIFSLDTIRVKVEWYIVNNLFTDKCFPILA